ncbi:hypothetical protein D3C76_1134040 [compost metagenome]
MSANILIQGWLREEEQGADYEEHDFLLVDDESPQRGQPLAERLEEIQSRTVTARYWVCEEKCTKEQAQDSFLRHVMGFCDVDHTARYSEYTGYLWTDEYLNVGGHDIIAELRSYIGEWLILEIEVH